MANGSVQIDPQTGERIAIDPATGERIGGTGGAGADTSKGYLAGALPAFGAGISPVPASVFGEAWNAIRHPTTAGLDLLKGTAAEIFAPPQWGDFSMAKGLARGDLAAALTPPGSPQAAVTDLAKGIVGASQQQLARAQAAEARQDPYLAGPGDLSTALAYVPVVGPQVGAGLERFRQGQLAGNKAEMGAGIGQTAAVPASFLLPEAAESVLNLAGRAVKPLAGAFAKGMETVPAGASKAEAFSKADVLNTASDMGVQLPLGKATGVGLVKGAETAAEHSLFGFRPMERLAQANQAALDTRWGSMLNEVDPNVVGESPLAAGENLQNQGKALFETEKQGVHAGYDQMEPYLGRMGKGSLNELADFGRSKLIDPYTNELVILPDYLSQPANEALDVRRISRRTPQLAGAGSTLPLPEAAAGGVRPDLSADLPAGPAVAGFDGDTLNLKTPGGDLPANYRVVEAGDLTPSHDPRTFRPNPDYPAGVQERNYDTDRVGQARVIGQAQQYDPSFTINTNPDAVNGPPVILADGTVLGGNSRAMSTQRLYDAGRGDLYKQRLMNQAGQFGLDPADIQNMNQPVLVRQLGMTPGTVDDARRIASDLNRPFTAALSDSERAVSAGRSLTPGTLQAIGGIFDELPADATLNDLLEARARPMFSLLRRDGLIPDQEIARYWDMPAGGFTPEGKLFVKKALLGSTINDVGLLDRAPDSLLNRVGRTLPDMSRVMARGGEWDLAPVVQQALSEHANLAARGLSLEDYLAQPQMFGGALNPAVETIMRRLNQSGPGYRDALRQFASDAAADVPGQGTLGGFARPEAWRSFNDAFGTALSEQQYNEAIRDAESGVLNGIQSRGAQQVFGAGRGAQAGAGAAAAAREPGAVGAAQAGGGQPGGGAPQAGGNAGLRAGVGGAGVPAAAAELGPPDTVNWPSLRNIRSYFFNEANDYTGPIREERNAMYAEMTKRVDSAMADVAREAGPDVEETWRSANAANKRFQEDWNSAGSALKPLVSTPDTQLANLQQKYLTQGKVGGEPKKILALQNKGLDLSGLRRQALEQIADKKFSVARDGNLGGFSDDFLHALFDSVDPQYVDRLYGFGAVKRALGENFNPSGTAKAMLASQAAGVLPSLLLSPMYTIGAAGANYGLARALTSPALVDYLTSPAAGTIGRAISPQMAAGWRLAQFLKQSQDQDQQQQ